MQQMIVDFAFRNLFSSILDFNQLKKLCLDLEHV